MLFSSMIFLWLFLPTVFLLYRLIKNNLARNILLLVASLVFYGWGEPKYILLMIVSILMNYSFGLLIHYNKKQIPRTLALFFCIAINLMLLGYFKYFNFFVDIANSVTGTQIFAIRNIVLPIGISFYTFQALSYVIDLYRKQIQVQKNIYKVALYISFFPQLIAGPIVRYRDIEKQIDFRKIHPVQTAFGIKRFIYGLSKKVLIANSMALVVDQIYALSPEQLSSSLAWLAAICYTLQIYFDFSGYSDMAIGLGKMFGFTFLENFNYPYEATSIQQFWRKWHISLSTWFREYVYIPLGGNRKGPMRTYLNLVIVFFVTGLWHGASWNFVVWGLYHGFFLVIERLFLGKLLEKCKFKFINWIYMMLVVMIGWVIFRTDDLRSAYHMLKLMFGMSTASSSLSIMQFINVKGFVLLGAGILFSGLIQKNKKLRFNLYDENKIKIAEIFVLIALFSYCVFSLVSGTYNPFIYFRF